MINTNCSICKAFLHFGCAALRESAFRQISKIAKQNWCSSKFKLTIDSKFKYL